MGQHWPVIQHHELLWHIRFGVIGGHTAACARRHNQRGQSPGPVWGLLMRCVSHKGFIAKRLYKVYSFVGNALQRRFVIVA